MYLMIKEQLVLIKTHFSEDQKYNFGHHLTQSFTDYILTLLSMLHIVLNLALFH